MSAGSSQGRCMEATAACMLISASDSPLASAHDLESISLRTPRQVRAEGKGVHNILPSSSRPRAPGQCVGGVESGMMSSDTDVPHQGKELVYVLIEIKNKGFMCLLSNLHP